MYLAISAMIQKKSKVIPPRRNVVCTLHFSNVHEWARTCRLIRMCMYIVQVDPHEHVCEHGSWCLALQLVVRPKVVRAAFGRVGRAKVVRAA